MSVPLGKPGSSQDEAVPARRHSENRLLTTGFGIIPKSKENPPNPPKSSPHPQFVVTTSVVIPQVKGKTPQTPLNQAPIRPNIRRNPENLASERM